GVKDRVLFLGHVPHEEMSKIYNTADVLLLTSEMEGTPMVILEALACGTPVVTTPVGGIPVLVKNDENGLLLADTSPSAIACAVQQCLNYRWDRAALAFSIRDWSS